MGKIPRGASGGPSPNQVYLLSEGREISHYDCSNKRDGTATNVQGRHRAAHKK